MKLRVMGNVAWSPFITLVSEPPPFLFGLEPISSKRVVPHCLLLG